MNPASSEKDPQLGNMFDQLRAVRSKARAVDGIDLVSDPTPAAINERGSTGRSRCAHRLFCRYPRCCCRLYWSSQAPSQASVDFDKLDQIVTAHFAEASEPSTTPMVWSSPTDSLLSDSLLSDSLRSDARAIDASVDPSEPNQSN